MAERRMDPEDGAAYTFEEMEIYYKGKYKRAAIKAYWIDQCEPVQQVTSKSNCGPQTGSTSKGKSKAQAKSKSEVEPKVTSKSESEAKPEAKSRFKVKPKGKSKSESEARARPQAEAASQATVDAIVGAILHTGADLNSSELRKTLYQSLMKYKPNPFVPALLQALPRHSSLKTMDLSDLNIHDCIDDLAAVLQSHTSLHSLKIACCSLNGGSAQVLALALAVNSHLTELDVRANEIGDVGATAFMRASLRKLILGSCRIGVDGFEEIASLLREDTTLVDLNLYRGNSANMSEDVLVKFAAALEVNGTLTSLNISDHSTPAESRDALCLSFARALRVNQSLRSLILRLSGVTADGATAMADSLRVNTTLTELDLNTNPKIGPEGGKALANMLETNSTLKVVKLWNSVREGFSPHSSGAASLVEVLPNSHVEELDIGFYGVVSGSGAILQTALRSSVFLRALHLKKCGLDAPTIALLAEGLAVNTSLTFLDLSANGFATRGVISLSAALDKNRTLQSLILCHDSEVPAVVGDEGAAALVQMLEDNPVITNLVADGPTCTRLPPRALELLERNRLGGSVVFTISALQATDDTLPQIVATNLNGDPIVCVEGVETLAALRMILAERSGVKDAKLLTPGGDVLEASSDSECLSMLRPRLII